jgi:4-amino-4-deoxy-L-arabinose transferase-like glycosyltransferase
MRPPAGPIFFGVMSAILLFPWSLAALAIIGFWRKRRKNKKLREKERDAIP